MSVECSALQHAQPSLSNPNPLYLCGHQGEKLSSFDFQRFCDVQKDQHVYALMTTLDLTDVALGFADPLSQHALMQPSSFTGFPN